MKLPLVALAVALAAPALTAPARPTISSPPLPGDVWVVDPGQPGAFASIQTAVTVAIDGDVVLIRSGLYQESVDIIGRGIAVVGEGGVRIEGTLTVAGVRPNTAVVIGGLEVEARENFRRSALEIDQCDGAVRIVECDLIGARDTQSGLMIGATGPGAEAAGSRDVAFIDCRVEGGAPGNYAGLVAGARYKGASGLDATDIGRLSLIRTVFIGAMGSNDIFGFGGDGGDGVHIEAGARTWIAYSAFIGGEGGIGDLGTNAISGDGGTGMFATGDVWDFEGVFIAGVEGCASGSFCNPGSPGVPTAGPATIRSLAGFPTRFEVPLIVREGQAFTLEVDSVAGEDVRLVTGDRTDATFRPRARQPLLVERPAVYSFAPIATIPASGQLCMQRTAPQVAGPDRGQVRWLQVEVDEPGGGRYLSSPRPMIVLDALL